MDIPTRFAWRKLGRIFTPPKNDWTVSHAMVPTVRPMSASIYRVYFSGRDGQSRSVFGWYEADAEAGWRVVRMCEHPALSPGADGCFDDSGVTGCWLLDVNAEWWLYYVGWNRGHRVPFYNSIGLAA